MFCWLGWHKWGDAYDVERHGSNSNHPLLAIVELFTTRWTCKRRCLRCFKVKEDDYKK